MLLKGGSPQQGTREGQVFESIGEQTSIVAGCLRPSDCLDPGDSEQQNIDSDFIAFMKSEYNPVKLRNTSEEAVQNLRISLGCLYKS